MVFSHASMGPGLFSPEDNDCPRIRPGPLDASMGPGLFSPEDRWGQTWIVMFSPLQWGRACSARRTLLCADAVVT